MRVREPGTGGVCLSKKSWIVAAVAVVTLTVLALVGVIRFHARAAVSPPGGGGPTPGETSGPAQPEPSPAPPVVPAPEPPPLPPPSTLVAYDGPVEHIFFHPLVVYPDLAFKGSMAKGYNDWFVTVREFDRIIDALYRNGFILVDIRSQYEEKLENGKTVLVRKPLLLPEHKKPLVISIDDMNYYDYMREHGNVWRLVLDEQGNVATESYNESHEKVIAYDNEIVPILDRFVREHPDFSLNGAKGVIALTGYQGILGYRTNETGSPNFATEKAQALRVVQRLKETGWSFASHGWGHLDAAKISYATFVRDTARWKAEVEPLIGPTPVYIYPFGAQVFPGDPKFQYLLEQGFQIMCAIGPQPFLDVKPGYIRMDRRHIDGIALHSQRKLLLSLFDADQMIESEVRGKEY